MRTLALLLSFALAPACGSSELDGARSRWEHRDPTQRYELTSHQQCDCGANLNRPIRVTASGDTLWSAVFSDDNQPVDADTQRYLYTVDRLFDRLQDAIEADREVSATYSLTGYPTFVGIDEQLRPVDGGWSLTVTDFALVAETNR